MARCKYGKLKNPRGRRKCRKQPRKGGKRVARRSGKQCKNIQLSCRTVRPGLPKICKVRVTGEPERTMTSTKAGAFVGKLYKALRRRGCKPVISRS